MFKTINWCGYTWDCCMDSDRIVREETPYMWCDENMINVTEDGVLVLDALFNPKDIQHWNGKTYHTKYGVGTIVSNKSEKFSYGKYSCEVQIPDGSNCWVSFWLYGADAKWPKGGEIDIMEAFQNNTTYFRFTIPQPPYIVPSWWVTTNMHYAKEDGSHGYYGSRGLSICKMWKSPVKRFVKYECEWLPDKITFYADGKKIRKIVGYPKISQEMRVVLDCWGQETNFVVTQPMKCKNFKYEPF